MKHQITCEICGSEMEQGQLKEHQASNASGHSPCYDALSTIGGFLGEDAKIDWFEVEAELNENYRNLSKKEKKDLKAGTSQELEALATEFSTNQKLPTAKLEPKGLTLRQINLVKLQKSFKNDQTSSTPSENEEGLAFLKNRYPVDFAIMKNVEIDGSESEKKPLETHSTTEQNIKRADEAIAKWNEFLKLEERNNQND